MAEGILQKTGPFTKFIFSAFVVLSSFLITMAVGLFLAVPIFGMGFTELMESLSNITQPDSVNLLKYFQVVQSIGLFIIPPFILGRFFSGNSFKYLKINKKANWTIIIFTAIIIFSAIPLINLIAHLNTKISLPDFMSSLEEWMKQTEDAAQRLTEQFMKADNLTGLFVNIIVIAVIPAIGEELLFRGVIQRLFSEWTRNVHAGIWISAIIFSAMHLQFYGFFPRTLLGVLFGYMLVWSGNMWIPITAHFFNNAIAVLVYYLIQRKQVGEDMETIGAGPSDWIYVIISLGFFILLLFVFYRTVKKHPV